LRYFPNMLRHHWTSNSHTFSFARAKLCVYFFLLLSKRRLELSYWGESSRFPCTERCLQFRSKVFDKSYLVLSSQGVPLVVHREPKIYASHASRTIS